MIILTLRHGVRLVAATAIATACLTSCIDEDLTQCGKNYTVDYTVRQLTDVPAILQRHLTTPAEQQLSAQLLAPLNRVFASTAADLDLSFFDSATGNVVQHEQHDINASHAQYTLYLKKLDYRNLALANAAAEPFVAVDGAASSSTLTLSQTPSDTIDTHTHPLFTSRLDMTLDDQSQSYHADLYMQNCASCLVLDPGTNVVQSLSGYVDDMATEFSVSDSTYHFARHTVVRSTPVSAGGQYALYAASMPSPMAAQTYTSADGISQTATWRIGIVVRMADRYTKTTLYVQEPLRAGELRIIKCKINNRGEVVPNLHNVGASVELDWKPGGDHNIDI